MSHSSNSKEGAPFLHSVDPTKQHAHRADGHVVHEVREATHDVHQKIENMTDSHGHDENGKDIHRETTNSVEHHEDHGHHDRTEHGHTAVHHPEAETKLHLHAEKVTHGEKFESMKNATLEELKAEKEEKLRGQYRFGKALGKPWAWVKGLFSTKNKTTVGKVGTWGLRLGTATSMLSLPSLWNSVQGAGNYLSATKLGLAIKDVGIAFWDVLSKGGTALWNFVTQGASTPGFISSAISNTSAFASKIGLTTFFGKMGTLLGLSGKAILGLLTTIGPFMWVVFAGLLATKAISFVIKNTAKAKLKDLKESPTPKANH